MDGIATGNSIYVCVYVYIYILYYIYIYSDAEAKFAGEGVELRLVTQGNMLPSESMYSRYIFFVKIKKSKNKSDW